jgi:hypothetical protein
MRPSEGNWNEQVTNAVNLMSKEIQEIKKFQRLCEHDKDVATLMQLNEKLMTQATNYTNLVMVAGYAGYFAFWSTLITKLPNWLYALSGLLALLSLLLFISWEVTKMIWGNAHMNRTNKIITASNGPNAINAFTAAYQLYSVKTHRIWTWFLVPTVACGVGAGLLLLGFFCWKILQLLP